MGQIRNIIFDFDGTLADTAPLIVRTMHQTIRQMGLPARRDDECRATIGVRLEDVPEVLWGRPEIGVEFATLYRKLFDELKRPLDVRCFPGVGETIRRLHAAGIRMAIASSRSHKSLAEYVDLFGFGDIFSMLIGGNDVKRGKPAPDPVLAITEALGWEPAETLTVGDAPVDILMGKSAGTLTCAVTYGNGTEAELSSVNPDYTIPDFRELGLIVLD